MAVESCCLINEEERKVANAPQAYTGGEGIDHWLISTYICANYIGLLDRNLAVSSLLLLIRYADT
jgi:hypothetical protein